MTRLVFIPAVFQDSNFKLLYAKLYGYLWDKTLHSSSSPWGETEIIKTVTVEWLDLSHINMFDSLLEYLTMFSVKYHIKPNIVFSTSAVNLRVTGCVHQQAITPLIFNGRKLFALKFARWEKLSEHRVNRAGLYLGKAQYYANALRYHDSIDLSKLTIDSSPTGLAVDT